MKKRAFEPLVCGQGRVRRYMVSIGAALVAVSSVMLACTMAADSRVESAGPVFSGMKSENVGGKEHRVTRRDVPLPGEMRNPTDLESHVMMTFDLYARDVHSQLGTMMAMYRLPIEGAAEGQEEFVYAFVMYNPESRASCKIHSFDDMVYLTDASGDVWQGRLDEIENLDWVRNEPWPFSNAAVSPFMPSAVVEDIYVHQRSSVDSVGSRSAPRTIQTPSGPIQVNHAIHGVSISLRAPIGVGPLTISRENKSRDELGDSYSLIHYEIDGIGRIVSYRVGDEPATTITYASGTPNNFPLPDPAHGGNWRLHRWQFIEGENHEAMFEPEVIKKLAQEWGM